MLHLNGYIHLYPCIRTHACIPVRAHSYKDLKESEAQLVEDITSLEELAREFQAEKKHKAQLVSKLKEKLEAERQAHQASIAAFTAQIEELNAENQDMQQQCQGRTDTIPSRILARGV